MLDRACYILVKPENHIDLYLFFLHLDGFSQGENAVAESGAVTEKDFISNIINLTF
jgi:hypothetical protein